MKAIGVDCIFKSDGSVRVRRLEIEGEWVAVGQGRQWMDGYGRHLLIMLPHNQIREIILRSDTLIWEMVVVFGPKDPRIV